MTSDKKVKRIVLGEGWVTICGTMPDYVFWLDSIKRKSHKKYMQRGKKVRLIAELLPEKRGK